MFHPSTSALNPLRRSWLAGLSLSAALFLTGCQWPQSREALHGAWLRTVESVRKPFDRLNQPPELTTRVNTEPTGAYVEVNGQYVGRTPVLIHWAELLRQKPELAEAETIVFKAYAPGSGLYTHSRIYRTNPGEKDSAFPPRRVEFHLAQKPMDKSEEE